VISRRGYGGQLLLFLGVPQPHIYGHAATFTRPILFLQLAIGHWVSGLQAKVLDQDVRSIASSKIVIGLALTTIVPLRGDIFEKNSG
jgi:hypothetical protein